jgi:3D (Asp-Asp-Asp) domain-containing protein
MEGQLKPAPGTRLQFKATAYCKGQTTASGVAVRSGVVAADETLLPVGSVIQADFEMPEYNGVYTVMDTGPEVQGRELDVYMWSCFEALRFGRQDVHIVVLRLGWNPKDTTPLIETLFHRRLPGDTDEDARPFRAAAQAARAAPVCGAAGDAAPESDLRRHRSRRRTCRRAAARSLGCARELLLKCPS